MSHPAAPENSTAVFHEARILLVDDEPHNIEIITRILREAGYQNLHGLTDPRAVPAAYADWAPDLVILDLRMPHVDGFMLLQHLRTHSSSAIFLPILVLTSDWTPDARHRALACGASDFLTRPLDTSEVILRVGNLLSTRSLQLQLAHQNETLEQAVQTRTAELLETNERLRSEIEARERAEASLRRHATFVHLLEVITVAASQSAPVHQTFQVALAQVCESMGWQIGHALRRHSGAPLSSTGLWYSKYPDGFRKFRHISESEGFASGVGLPGRVLASGQPAWIPNLATDINFRRFSVAQEEGLTCGFALPILINNEVAAVLEFFGQSFEPPDAETLEIMQQIGAQLGRVLERQRHEDALRSSEAKFRSLVQLGTDGIVLGDAWGRILSWNHGAQQIFGYTEDEALGRPLAMLLPERDRKDFPPAGEELLSRPEVQRMVGKMHVVTGRRRDGVEFSMELAGDIWTTWDGTFCSAVIRDTSGRRRMEDALRQSEERLRRLLEATKIVPWTFDLEAHRMTYVGPQIVPLFGYPIEAWEEPGFCCEHVHLEDREWATSYAQEAQTRQGSFELEFRMLAADGRVVWVHVLASVSSLNGRLANGFLLDITATRQTQDSLRQYASMVEFSSDAIMAASVDGTFLSWNKGAEALFGFSRGEIVGRETALIQPEDLQEEHREIVNRVVSGAHVVQLETRRKCKSGAEVEVALTVSPLRDANGRVVALSTIARDISERKRAELEMKRSHERLEREVAERTAELQEANVKLRAEIQGHFQTESALRASEERLKLLIAAIEEIIFEFDGAGRFVNLWSGQPELLAHLPAELEGQRVQDIFGDGLSQPITETIQRVLEQGRPETLEHNFDLPHGRRWYLSRVAPLTDRTGFRSSVCLFARDITERKRWEEELRQAKEDAERANSAKTEFLSRMSHELRTPLNAILGFTQLVDRSRLLPEDCEGLDQILKAGQHLLSLINEVLDMARIEVGRLTLTLDPILCEELLTETLGLVRPLASARGITLQSSGCANLRVIADRQRLRQVLLNLLSNAIKYNRPSGTVTVECQRGEACLRIAIRDTGRGIAPDRIGQLFKAFERLDTAPGAVEGIGLGLAISKRLVELMGGSIGVESKMEEGSTFWFSLPLAEEDTPETLAEFAGAPVLTVPPQTSCTILYIEDNLSNLKLVERILARHPGIHLLAATSGLPGLELAFQHEPACILLDLRLPDIHGEELLARLRADPRTAHTPVIVTSADPRAVTMQRLRDTSVQGFLEKPVDVGEFVAALNQVLALLGESETPS